MVSAAKRGHPVGLPKQPDQNEIERLYFPFFIDDSTR